MGDRGEKGEGGGRIARAQLKSIIGYLLLGGEARRCDGRSARVARGSMRLEGGGWWWFGTHNPSICHDTIIAVPWCSWRAIHGETNGRARVHAFARQNRGEGQGRGKAKSTKANRPMLLFQRVLGEIVGTAITISLENYSKYDGNILALAETYVFVRTRIRESLKFIGLSVAIYRSVGRAGVRWKGDRAADS